MPLAEDLATLGQQLQAALLKLYQPQAGGLSSLGFIPGGVPVALEDGIVQPESPGSTQEVVNVLQLGEWLRAAGVDAAVQIDIDAASVLGSPVGADSSLSEYCRLIARFAKPLEPVSTPAGERVAEEISTALGFVGESGTVPLTTVPLDWPLAGSTAWNVFQSQQSTNTQTTVVGSAPPATPTPATPAPVAPLWQLRQLPVERALLNAAQTEPLTTPPAAAQTGTSASPMAAPPTAVDHALLGLDPPARRRLDIETRVVPPLPSRPLARTAVATQLAAAPALSLLQVNAQLFAAAPVVSAPVVSSSDQSVSVTLSVEHTLAAVNRSPWWQGALIADPGWYIPGLARGSYVGESPEPEKAPYALPVAIVLARNLSLSGTWSSEDAASLVASELVFGPFALKGASVSSSEQLTTISVPGMSLIALFGEPLPVLPPSNPPAVEASEAAPSQSSAVEASNPVQASTTGGTP